MLLEVPHKETCVWANERVIRRYPDRVLSEPYLKSANRINSQTGNDDSASLTFVQGRKIFGVGSVLSNVAELDQEIELYNGMKSELETHHMGKWVLIHDLKLISIHDSFESAAEDAVKKFGRGPYLLRQVGAPPVVLPASVMYRLEYGTDKLRIR